MAIKGLMSPVYRIYEKERKFLLIGAILLPFTVCGRLSRGGTSEPDFYGPIFPSAVLKYSQIRQDLLRFVPCR